MASNARGDWPLVSTWNQKSAQLFKSCYPGSDAVVKNMSVLWMWGASEYKLTAGTGTFTVTGTAASLEYNRRVSAGTGTFAVTGSPVAFIYSAMAKKLAAGAGTFTVTGAAATLRRGFSLPAGSGSYAVTGTAASLKRTFKLAAGAGSFLVTGTAAGLLRKGQINAGSGTFTITGSPIGFQRLLQTGMADTASLGAIMDAEYVYPIVREKIPYKATGRRLTLKIRSNEAGRWMKLYDIAALVRPYVGRSRSDRTRVKGVGRHITVKFSSEGGKPLRLGYAGFTTLPLVGETRSSAVETKGTGNHITVKFSSDGGKPMQLSYAGLQIEGYAAR